MKKTKFIIVSKDNESKLSPKDFAEVEDRVDVEYIYNNKKPLTIIYNEKLIAERSNRVHDFIVFIHADAILNIKHFLEHLYECKDRYDIVGLCGTEVVNVSLSPLNWYTSSNLSPSKRWGCVTHGEIGNQMSYFSADRQNVQDHRVGCIDGVCIVFGEKALDSDILFDENFKYDQYDTDLSFQCILKYKLRLGVIVETSLLHFSVGKSILSDEFLSTEMILRDKWNLGYPEKSRIKAMHDAQESI